MYLNSVSIKTNVNKLLNYLPDIYNLIAKDPFAPKYQLLINKQRQADGIFFQ